MTSVPYNPNIPAFPDTSLSNTQPDLLNNFLTLYNAFAVNHVPLDALSSAGNHTIIQLLEQENAPQTDVSEISVYTKLAKYSDGNTKTTDQVFIRYQNNIQEFSYICYQLYGLTATPNQTPFFTFLPGDILLYFGSFNNLPNNTLNLYPPVAKKIISFSSCPLGPLSTVPGGSHKSQVELEEDPANGFFSKIVVTNALGDNQVAVPSYYLIMANI